MRYKSVLDVIDHYDLDNAMVGVIASHSALDLADGVTDEGYETLAVCEKGREKTYARYSRIIKKSLVLESFKHIMKDDVQKRLRDWNVLFVPNRSLTAYVDIKEIETNFLVPVFGNRDMLKTDERKHQYELFKDAGILHPKKLKSYRDIDTLCMVKAKEPRKKIERAFFTCDSPKEFLLKYKSIFGSTVSDLDERIETDEIWIEEFADGAQFNFNYFYSPLEKRVEFLGIDRRIQTNLDGILRLPAEEQIGRKLPIKYVEIGHESATIRESMLEKVFDIAEKFVAASKRLYPPGIIGPFSLQGAVGTDLKIVIYDLSPRMPGSPVLYSSPYSKYYFGRNITSGHRVAMEISKAIKTKELEKIIT
jgi:5-formaminoimidazole-4-carboxamide-1-(beta)-D-ribofuranosyl 5'-monophosphate synthetase